MHRGDRITARFEILAEAGRGGMGTVFRARDWRDRRDVALKLLNVADGSPRFDREAAILAGLRHPNVVAYITHGAVPDGPHFLVMEWVDGETLAQRLRRDPLDARAAVAMAIQVAQALVALHAAGIVHRDVKPSNLMLVAGDVAQVKLVDFGIARRTTDIARLTRTGALIGSAGYMAPEQARGEDVIDGRADVFALGCVLHQCLTGQPAFAADSVLASRAKVLLHTPPPARLLAPWIPGALDELVGAMLARAARDRPDAAATLAALTALGDVPAIRHSDPRARTSPDETYTPPAIDVQVCGVLVALGEAALDTGAITRFAAALDHTAVESFVGGVAVTLIGSAAEAARLALTFAASLPDARIAVIAGESADEVIDRGARLLDEVGIAASAADASGTVHATDPATPATGVWLDRATARLLGDGFLLEHTGARARLTGAA
ncbi:MAG: serine/threonine protein kinase [Deltaproteobacteria bacterium]|nr:serine/threonine protein kinase [Deltaproteobacteria bacterium]